MTWEIIYSTDMWKRYWNYGKIYNTTKGVKVKGEVPECLDVSERALQGLILD